MLREATRPLPDEALGGFADGTRSSRSGSALNSVYTRMRHATLSGIR